MTWPQVALAAINVVQVIALAWIAAWARTTHREVERINGELAEALGGGVDQELPSTIRDDRERRRRGRARARARRSP